MQGSNAAHLAGVTTYILPLCITSSTLLRASRIPHRASAPQKAFPSIVRASRVVYLTTAEVRMAQRMMCCTRLLPEHCQAREIYSDYERLGNGQSCTICRCHIAQFFRSQMTAKSSRKLAALSVWSMFSLQVQPSSH